MLCGVFFSWLRCEYFEIRKRKFFQENQFKIIIDFGFSRNKRLKSGTFACDFFKLN